MSRSPVVMAHLGGAMAPEQIDAASDRVRAFEAYHGYGFWGVERRGDGVSSASAGSSTFPI